MKRGDLVIGERILVGNDTATYRGHLVGGDTALILKLTTEEHPHPRTLARLRHEHTLLSRLEGDGAPRTMGLLPHGNGLVLMIEALEGRPLDAILREGPMSAEGATRMAIGVLRALAPVHARHVIHKDIKPGNILVDEVTGAVSIVDFGIASELPRVAGKPTASGSFEGTPVYMSPEQTGLVDAWVDTRSDIYSLGATLYEALTGKPPFDDAEPGQLFVDVLTRSPTPPHELVPRVPASLSAVVMKALAKSPEDRYQSVQGFAKDLEACLLTSTPFPLGRHELVTEPRPPQRLYGRAPEIEAFQAVLGRVSAGATELVLVSGEAGIGKSALIRHVRRTILQQGSMLFEGKCDQLERARPYAAIGRVIRDLAGKILSLPESKLSVFRSRLLSTLGVLGKLLTDLVPELERVVGQQPEAPSVGPTEAQNRFVLLVQKFFRVFADPNRPLVVFLDDLQWSDAASLALVRALLQDPDRQNLLLVGGHRDVEADHPLAQLPKEASAAGITPVFLRLGPLDAGAMRDFVADALGGDSAALLPLAQLLLEKTGGNPFFASQFLQHIHRERLLRFEPSEGGFVFDRDAIAALPATDNVLSLLEGELSKLPPDTRDVLAHAACLGHQFELGRLATTHARTRHETARALEPAISLGLVLVLDPEHRFYVGEEVSERDFDFAVTYRFLHDRVQQAAYALVDDEARRALHLEIGRALLEANRKNHGLSFEAIHHLGLGAALITADVERVSVARLHYEAAISAKRSAAFDVAERYSRAGLAMLRERDLEADPDFAYTFALDAAECAFLAGFAERAEEGYTAAYAWASSTLEKAEVERQRTVFYTTVGRFPDALAAVKRGLLLLGAALPEGEAAIKEAVEQAIGAAQGALAAVSLDTLVNRPVSSDPLEIAIARLYIAAFPVTFFLDPSLNVLVTARHFGRALEHGHTEYSSLAYATYGSVSAILLGAFEQALSLGKLSLALVERHPAGLRAKVLNMYGVFIAHHTQPIADCIEVLERGIQVGLETGDFEFTAYSCINMSIFRLWQGKDASALLEDMDRLVATVTRTKSPFAMMMVTLSRQLARMLAGRTSGSLGDESFDEESFAQQIKQPGFEVPQRWLPSVRAIGCFYAGDYSGARAAITEAQRFPTAAMGTSIPKGTVLYAALTRLLLRQETADVPEGDEAALEAEIEELETFARFCPSTYEHQRLLIAAEQAWMRGDASAGMSHHEQAMAGARKIGHAQHEALAAELCARHCLKQGWSTTGSDLMVRAHAIYSSAGYELMAQRLAAQHEDLIARTRPAAAKGLLRGTMQGLTTGTGTGRRTYMGTLEVSAALEAAEALGTEIELDRFLSRFLELVLASGGAQRAVLILVHDEGLRVEGEATIAPNRISLGIGAYFETYEELPRSLIHYSARSGEAIRLADATTDERFSTDPYVVSRVPRSILCIPLLHRGRTLGILYVENRAVRGAFAGPRVELLHVIAHQAAISLENTRLYDQVRLASKALEQANSALSEEAERRAVALREATAELSYTNERLRHELTEREKAEHLRASLQEEMIQAQEARLEELSTPLIPITDEITVMPLIGTMDASRARQMLEAVLAGASTSRARVVIIDVTGVKSMDATVARVLVDTASVLRLLGAEAVITGIQPMTAQTLVSMGVELSAMATRSTLQAGIAYALGRTKTSLRGKGRMDRA